MSRKVKSREETKHDRAMGARIRSLRETKKISVATAAQILGCSRNRYYDIEQGRSSLSSWECKIIADYYGVTASKLYGGVNIDRFEFSKKAVDIINAMPSENKKLYVDIGTLLLNHLSPASKQNS